MAGTVLSTGAHGEEQEMMGAAHTGHQHGRTPRPVREAREWETLNSSVKTGL